jgi:hypothetical protein
LSAALKVFLNYTSQKSYAWKIQARNNRYSRKFPAFWSLEGGFLHSFAGKGKARKFRYSYGRKIWLPVTADTARKSRQVTTRYGWKIWLSITTETAGKSQQQTQ